jgi:hypothetical protein
MEEATAFFVKYKEWIFLALSVILGIPTGILSNRLDAYLQNRSLSVRARKIKTLLIRYITVKNRKEYKKFINSTSYNFWGDAILAVISVGLVVLIITLFPTYSLLRVIIETIVSIPMYYATVRTTKAMYDDVANMMDYLYFDRFKAKTIRKLKKLGCNPKDYGIE